MSQVLTAAATGGEHHLPMAPEMFGIIALGTFALLLAITWAFRNSANKHRR